MNSAVRRKYGGNDAQDGWKNQSGTRVAVDEAVARENARGLHRTVPSRGDLFGSEWVIPPKHTSCRVRLTFGEKATDCGNDDAFLVHHGYHRLKATGLVGSPLDKCRRYALSPRRLFGVERLVELFF